MMGIALGCNGRDAIFLKTAGPEALPYMYMLNAVLMIALSSVYTIVVDRIARHRFLIMLLIFFASNMLVLRMMFPLNYVWLPYAIFGLSEVITLTLYMHFWTFDWWSWFIGDYGGRHNNEVYCFYHTHGKSVYIVDSSVIIINSHYKIGI
jgi:hypothetical protein